jgi:hypothetical protein
MGKAVSVPRRDHAPQLVDEYCQLLTGLSEMLPIGVPDSILPASAVQLREAILSVATSSHGRRTGFSNPEFLRTAYLATASFLPYDQANEAARLHRAFNEGDQTYISSSAAQRALARARAMESEASTLAREFDRAMAADASDGLSTEIDTVLAVIGRSRINSRL